MSIRASMTQNFNMSLEAAIVHPNAIVRVAAVRMSALLLRTLPVLSNLKGQLTAKEG